MNEKTQTLLPATEPAGDAALGLVGPVLDLAVRGVDLLAGLLTVLLKLVFGIGYFLLGFLGLWEVVSRGFARSCRWETGSYKRDK